MFRGLMGSIAVLGLCVGLAVAADTKDAKDKKDAKQEQATITKVDPKNNTVTVKMKDKDGKDVEKTFKLTGEVRMFEEPSGKAAAIDIFSAGNDVLIVEEEGKLVEMHKNTAKDKAPEKTPKK